MSVFVLTQHVDSLTQHVRVASLDRGNEFAGADPRQGAIFPETGSGVLSDALVSSFTASL